MSDFGEDSSASFSGDDLAEAGSVVDGFPYRSLGELPPSRYRVQAFLTPYESATRADGSTVSLRFPCGDGSPKLDGAGSLRSEILDVDLTNGPQSLDLVLSVQNGPASPSGPESGGCQQGNFGDTDTFKHVKVRSAVLSEFWNRDMYIGANVLLPAGYNAADSTTRYPVVFSQSHWPGPGGAFGYPDWDDFQRSWDAGVIADSDGAPREIPKMILVTLRHEAPFYDDSYAVNSANLGPWGDAINDELLPYLDASFNTIAEPYARIQEGGSTGGWIAVANTVFRPDLYGSTFSYYPDSLDFNQHQDIDLYAGANAYTRPDGSKIGSVRSFPGGVEQVLTTVEQENQWELVFGTSSRSNLQWDIWNAVFGVQGLNGYPLEPWDKVTGEIYPDAVKYWKSMDMSEYLTQNWSTERNLGAALDGRLHISVGEQDNYYLDGGVIEFQKTVAGLGGSDWAEISVLPGVGHGGFYNNTDIWSYLDRMHAWVAAHAPDGPTPLISTDIADSGRGNSFEEVLRVGGHSAALERQAHPAITSESSRSLTGSVGSWDPGVALTSQWVVDGIPVPAESDLLGSVPALVLAPSDDQRTVQLQVTGRKRGYETESRLSNAVIVPASEGPSVPTPAPVPSETSVPGVGVPDSSDQHGGSLPTTGVAIPLWLAVLAGMSVASGVVTLIMRRRITRTIETPA
ncbi:alpha/beta hydrolase-fold protein [Plantibacter sp. ME-Dv--P-095]|uniref:alpha/beta hydrolase-fold protein n=1 Tax=Plantibacter sp. ME-Dv--P-095 TaxID=3040299 RepID=UPI00254CABF9|nr:alpha/beta hydrolase-fold protein [Plantibacter sp. ME-Dv--P-095]